MASFRIIKGEGKRVNVETGVEIVKVAKQRIGRNGFRVAGYEIRVPVREGGYDMMGFETTMREAKDSADERVEMVRENMAIAYAEATARQLNVNDELARKQFPSVFEILDAPATEDAPIMITEALPVRFIEEFSPALAAMGTVFEIVEGRNAAADIVEHPLYIIEAESSRQVVTVRTKRNGRWCYRLAYLDVLRAADGRRIAIPGRTLRQASEDAIRASEATAVRR